jgi:hypothetical protein
MRPVRDRDLYFFIDEAGDPTFYNRKGKLIVGSEGCSSRLILGFIRVKSDPTEMRQKLQALHQEILNDPYFQQLPSFTQTSLALHASKDAPEIRYLVFKLIRELNFRAVFVVSQKDEKLFRKRYHANADEYYDDLVSRLLQNSLHRYERNHICIAFRGSKTRQEPLETAVKLARQRFQDLHQVDRKTEVFVEVQSPKGEPCLSVIDYVGWALQRAYTGDMKYYRLIEDKVSFISELVANKRPKNYSRRHPLQID